MATIQERDVNEAVIPNLLPWGRTQQITHSYGGSTKTSSRITQDVRVVTLICFDCVPRGDVSGGNDGAHVHFKVGSQDSVEADSTAAVIPPSGRVDVPVPRDLASDDSTGAGVAVYTEADNVDVFVVERA